MPKSKIRDRDGVFIRRGSYYISFIDAQGRRKYMREYYWLQNYSNVK